MKKFPSLERKIFVPGEYNWIDETCSNSTLYFTYTEFKKKINKKEERDGGYKKEIAIVRVIFLCPLDQKLASLSV